MHGKGKKTRQPKRVFRAMNRQLRIYPIFRISPRYSVRITVGRVFGVQFSIFCLNGIRFFLRLRLGKIEVALEATGRSSEGEGCENNDSAHEK